MKILNFGSLNIDRVYNVAHFVEPGETVMAQQYSIFCGGKGLNQSIALARAGAMVYHAGMVGTDGSMLTDALSEAGVNVTCIKAIDGASGHAVIEVDESGQNRIIVCPGSNGQITEAFINQVLSRFEAGDILLLQNEISNVSYIIEEAHKRKMKIALNPSPVDSSLDTYPLKLIDYFILNEVEGRLLAGMDSDDEKEILNGLSTRFPNASIILTLGINGAYFKKGERFLYHPVCKVTAVDTTAAGDTFCGYFLACLSAGKTPEDALHYASLASGIVVGKRGASPSIPTWEEVLEFEKTAVMR